MSKMWSLVLLLLLLLLLLLFLFLLLILLLLRDFVFEISRQRCWKTRTWRQLLVKSHAQRSSWLFISLETIVKTFLTEFSAYSESHFYTKVMYDNFTLRVFGIRWCSIIHCCFGSGWKFGLFCIRLRLVYSRLNCSIF